MAGFSSITGDESIMFADNVSFDGTKRGGKVTTNGQLLIGSTASPHIRVATLTAGTGITITNGPGSISIAADGSVIGETITGNTGGALSPTAGNWNILGTSTNGIRTSGSGSTLTTRMQSPYADADFSFESQTGGSTRTLTIQNTVDAASSQATNLIKVAGTTSGNPWTQYTVGSAASYSIGIDTQNASGVGTRALVISSTQTATSSPATGHILLSFSSASTSLGSAATFWVPAVAVGGLANAGGNTNLNVINTSTTASSDASLSLQVSATTGGNAHVDYTGPSNNWSHGVDKSDSNSWKLTQATSGVFPQSTVAMKSTTGGNITFPTTSAFSAKKTSNSTNATGDGTNFTIIFDSVTFDQNSNYNNSTGVFTAPITGKYQFGCVISAANLTASFTSCIVTYSVSSAGESTRICDINVGAVRSSSNTFSIAGSTQISMAANDTISVVISISGGTKTVTVQSDPNSYVTAFWGKLIC